VSQETCHLSWSRAKASGGVHRCGRFPGKASDALAGMRPFAVTAHVTASPFDARSNPEVHSSLLRCCPFLLQFACFCPAIPADDRRRRRSAIAGRSDQRAGDIAGASEIGAARARACFPSSRRTADSVKAAPRHGGVNCEPSWPHAATDARIDLHDGCKCRF
jgi:hypothetical protein